MHIECLDRYAAGLSENTAQAGYSCPSCEKPIMPPAEDESGLAVKIRQHLSSVEWGKTLLAACEASKAPQVEEQVIDVPPPGTIWF